MVTQTRITVSIRGTFDIVAGLKLVELVSVKPMPVPLSVQ
jgi:hypothetical protein